ncbi:MAG: class I SAM-dependent methyltransferase, partial [Sandaracinaceae bacterium]|nr:class I SAM-dependent methyltransferase [Sandaracinaceae bacterium]
LELSHPITGEPLVLEAPIPQSFLRHLEGEHDPYVPAALRDALALALERRFALARRPGTDCHRVIHEAGDGLPRVAVDRYGEWLVVSDYGLEERELDRVLDALGALEPRGLYLKRRPKQANVIVDARSESFAPSAPVRGEPAPEILVVHEEAIPFEVRLGEGLSTGLFLDQRGNRLRVREAASGKRVLNLFAYTCAFGVAAARGGARETVNVDASARLLEWGERNYVCAGLDPSGHRFVRGDVFETLEVMHRAGERFDLVCVDPPTYSRTKASRWTSGRDWERLALLALRVLAGGGAMLACSNDRRIPSRVLRRSLLEAARRAGVPVNRIRDLACPIDFPPPPGAEPHLKSLWLER